jgi:FixJ family two-component response regulator
LIGGKTGPAAAINTFKRIEESYFHMPVVTLISGGDVDAAVDSVKKGAYDFVVVGPYDDEHLVRDTALVQA